MSFVFTFNAFSQLIVDSTGDVSVSGTSSFYDTVSVVGGLSTTPPFKSAGNGEPYPTIEMDYSLNLKPYLGSYSYHVGSCGTSTDPWLKMYSITSYSNHVYWSSDSRIKENIRPISNSLDILKLLKPVKFDFKETEVIKTPELEPFIKNLNTDLKDHLGFIAQDVNEVLPEAVFYDSTGDQFYIDYIAIIPLLVDAINEQQVTISSLESQLNLLGSEKKSLPLTENADLKSVRENAKLFQNNPNPFNQVTKIKCMIPHDISSAFVNIYDMQGIQKQVYSVLERGETELQIPASEYRPGIYLYTLIVDGVDIDTKRMILTD